MVLGCTRTITLVHRSIQIKWEIISHLATLPKCLSTEINNGINIARNFWQGEKNQLSLHKAISIEIVQTHYFVNNL